MSAGRPDSDEARPKRVERAPHQWHRDEHRDQADDWPARPEAPEKDRDLGTEDGDDSGEIELPFYEDEQELHSSSSSSPRVPSFSSASRVSSATSGSGSSSKARR